MRQIDTITRRVRQAPPAPVTTYTFSPRKVARLLRYPLLVTTLVLVALPFVPQVSYSLRQVGIIPVAANALNTEQAHAAGHWLVLPEIGLDTQILEGADASTVDKGVWRNPQGATPGSMGNTVLLGHRYAYTQKDNSFYLLDKLKEGDVFSIDWDGTRLNYRVSKVWTVEATDLSIEAPTSDEVVTMYTCTPLLTGSKRLVVRGVPVR